MFKLQIFAVLLSLASQGVSVGCEEIGLDTYTNNVTKVKITQKDPLVAGQGFDIYDARDCIWRFHVPQNPTDDEKEDIYAFATKWRTDSNRISIAEWRDNENTVAATIHNFVNSLNENSMLWLKKASEAFQYAGLLRSSHVHPQGNLNHPFGTANIILPPGKQRLGLVNPYRSPDDDATQSAELDHATSIGIVGLSGTLDPTKDYAYALTFRLAEGLKHRFPKDVEDLGLPPPVEEFASYPRFQTGPWLKAERKGGECVVIDLRQVETYLKNTEPQKLSEVCNFARAAKRELESTMMPVSWAA